MSVAFLLFLSLLLGVRAFFYYVPLNRSMVSYGIKTGVEISLYFLIFETRLITATTIPSILLLVNLFIWVFESIIVDTKTAVRAARVSRTAIPGLLLATAALAFVFASPNAPELRDFAADITSRIGWTVLLRVAFAFVALFELGHLLPDLHSAPGRIVIFGFRVQGAFFATALLAIAAVILDITMAQKENRPRAAIRSTSAVVLAVICGAAVSWISKV